MTEAKKDILKYRKLSVIFSGGGTGGHLFPAIAIATGWKNKYPDSNILFVGAKGKMEMKKVPQAGFEITGLWIDGFHRGEIIRNLLLPVKIVISLIKSFFIVLRVKPDIIVGTGGYASFPLIFIGTRLGIPALIQEQNYYPGVTNKYLSRFVDVACTVSDSVKKYFPKAKNIVSGNPVRESLLQVTASKEEALKHFGLQPGKTTLFITGGSLGAGSINKAILKGIPLLVKENFQLIWQTGEYDYQSITRELDKDVKEHHYISDFVREMELAYKAADIVIARAGAITLSELALMGKAVILVPSPNVAEDHQTRNAQSLVKENAAILVEDKYVTENLTGAISELALAPEKIQLLEKNISKFARPDSVEIIINEMEKLVKIS